MLMLVCSHGRVTRRLQRVLWRHRNRRPPTLCRNTHLLHRWSVRHVVMFDYSLMLSSDSGAWSSVFSTVNTVLRVGSRDCWMDGAWCWHQEVTRSSPAWTISTTGQPDRMLRDAQKLSTTWNSYQHHTTHNRFTALFPGPVSYTHLTLPTILRV